MNLIWRKIRIGNTILAKWHITTDKQELPLYGRNLTLEMKKPNGEVVSMPFTITDTNIVNLTYEGKDQDMLGKYSLTLWENRGEANQHVVDACNAWQLVKCSCEADEQEIPNLELEVVELEGNLEVGEGGLIKAVLYTPQTLTDEEKAQARENINAKKGGYTRIEKLHDYLHEVWYDGVDYSFADMLPHTTLGGCTSIRKGKFFARNLDWQYSEAAEFFVHTPAADGRHAVDGFGGNIPSLTKEVVESGAWHPAYQWLPLAIADGHNDAGLCASMNVVPTKTAPNTYEKTTGTNPSKPTLNGLMIVRYILDNHTDALSAAQDIANNWNVVMPHTETFDQELHFLIADKTRTIVLEFVGNEAVIIQKANQEGYITNFRLNGVDETSIATMIDTIEPFGQGVERYGLIKQALVEPQSIEQCLTMAHALIYTHAYNDDATYNWRTDFAGLHDELTVQAAYDSPSVYDETLAAAHEAYLNRTRNGETWQTTHSVAYDIESGECVFLVQQDIETYTQRDMALPIDAYTKAETDALLEDKVDKITGKGLSTNDYDNGEKSKVGGSLAYISGESTLLPTGDITMSVCYGKHNGESGKVSMPLITPDNYEENAYGIIRGEDFGKFIDKVDKVYESPLSGLKFTHYANAASVGVEVERNGEVIHSLSVGMNGAYADNDKIATATDLAAKQDAISDLATIRTGAGKGATALQPSDIASWAKQPTKPAYTASEVGALPDDTEIPSKTSDLTNDSGFIGDAPSDNKQYARKNGAWSEVTGGGGGSDPEAVHFTPQTLTEAQKEQARSNIGASGIPEELIGLMCTSETLYKGKLTNGRYFCSKTKPTAADIAEIYSVPQTTNWSNVFFGMRNLTRMYCESWVTSEVTNLHGFLYFADKIETIDVRLWDCSEVTEIENSFVSASRLSSVIGGYQGFDAAAFNGISISFNVAATKLDRPSLRAIINGLADLTGLTEQTLTLGNTLKAKLTDEDILIATNKNWRIA